MQLAKQDMCQGTGHYFSLFWAMECPYGVACWGCQGCGWNLFLDFWGHLGAQYERDTRVTDFLGAVSGLRHTF